MPMLPAAGAATASSLVPCSSLSGGSTLWQRLSPLRPLPGCRGRDPGALVYARDGKKRRKPQQQRSCNGSTTSIEEFAAPTQLPPRRVDPSINISARKQIGWAKSIKEYERQQSRSYRKPRVARAFRQNGLDAEGHRKRREDHERLAEEARQHKSDRLMLNSMFNTNISAPGEQPMGVTLVDGYNMLFMMQRHNREVEKMMAAAEANPGVGALEAAREYLLQRLDVYSSQEGMYVHVVLDAMNQGFCSQHNKLGMIVTFTSTMEADTMIMLKAQEYIDRGVAKVCIVSDDREMTDLGTGSITYRQPGQQVVCAASCSSLVKLMEESQRKLEQNLEAAQCRLHSPFAALADKLGSTARVGQLDALRALRQDLAQQEREQARAAQRGWQ